MFRLIIMGATCSSKVKSSPVLSKRRFRVKCRKNIWDSKLRKYSKSIKTLKAKNPCLFQGLLFLGAPKEYRWEAWKVALNYKPQHNNYALLRVYCEENSELSIKKDLGRTFPEEGYFGKGSSGRRSLYNILTAFASAHPEIGYCQGMNYLVGILLLVSDGNESEVYGVLEQLLGELGFSGLFDFGFPCVKELCSKFHSGLNKYCRKVSVHLNEIGMDDNLWLVKWFMTMFAYSLPFSKVVRIWDAVFAKGMHYMVNISLGLVTLIKKSILEKDFFQVAEFLPLLETVKLDTDFLIRCSKQFKVSGELEDYSTDTDTQYT